MWFYNSLLACVMRGSSLLEGIQKPWHSMPSDILPKLLTTTCPTVWPSQKSKIGFIKNQSFLMEDICWFANGSKIYECTNPRGEYPCNLKNFTIIFPAEVQLKPMQICWRNNSLHGKQKIYIVRQLLSTKYLNSAEVIQKLSRTVDRPQADKPKGIKLSIFWYLDKLAKKEMNRHIDALARQGVVVMSLIGQVPMLGILKSSARNITTFWIEEWMLHYFWNLLC